MPSSGGSCSISRVTFPIQSQCQHSSSGHRTGYGAFAAAVLDRLPNATAVGLDISEPMLAVGKERMAHFGDRFAYHVGDIASGTLPADLPGPFDAAVASASIVHLPSETKQRLYAEIYRVLSPGGCFFNVEPVRPSEMRTWYGELAERERQHRGNHSELQHQFGSEADQHHHFEAEVDQVAYLRAAGFVRVDCYYKRLLQTVIGGYKPT